MKTEILYEDEDLIACYKSAGLPTQTSKVGEIDCIHEVKNYLAAVQPQVKGKPPYVGVINRLDQPVEGILLLAKNEYSAKLLSAQITDDSMQKYYYAVVEGKPLKQNGLLTDYIIKNGKTNLSQVVKPDEKGAKKAELFYETLQEDKDQSLLKIQLITGRHHQIRVQMSHRGNPILGDVKYGAKNNRQGIALCACRLMLLHPKTKKELDFAIKPRGTAFVPYIGKI